MSFAFPMTTVSLDLSNLGPLSQLVGTWIGEGVDTSPGGPSGPRITPFIEQLVVAAAPPVKLTKGPYSYSVSYDRHIYTKPNGTSPIVPVHDESGYWLWVPDEGGALIRQFVIPRGIAIMAGGTGQPTDTTLSVSAKKGQTTYGILDAPYMEAFAPTVEFICKFEIKGDVLDYEELSVLEVRGSRFDHTDKATLKRYL